MGAIIILAVLCVLFANDIITFNNKGSAIEENVKNNTTTGKESDTSKANESNQTSNSTNNFNYNSVGIDYNKFTEKFGTPTIGFVDMLSISFNSNSYNVGLKTDGKILINFEKEIENVVDVVDIKVFYDTEDQTDDLYILDKLGNLYKYTAKDYQNGSSKATQLKEYNNVKKIFIYYTRKPNSGGCDRLVIDIDNKYEEIKYLCA